jgi:hypothetical protein
LSLERAMKTRLFCLLLATALAGAAVARPATAQIQMSETERKAAARAAYLEGTRLQEEGKFDEALKRYDAAQKLFDAPTHLLRIAECQALTGRLVEASETYETLAHKALPAGAPEAFTQAQQQGQAELVPLRARIPTLRVTTRPGPQQLQNLQVNINGVLMPVELLGIARPLNPGTYRFSAQAAGWSTPQSVDVPLAEKEQKSVELTLVQGAAAPPVIVAPPPPPPPPYGAEKPTPPKAGTPTSTGLLFGLHAGAVVPAGDVTKNNKAEDVAKAGGGGGADVALRFARIVLVGAKFQYASLGAPATVSGAVGNVDVTTNTSYVGLNLGVVPNIDRVSFIGDVGIGSRTLAQKRVAPAINLDQSLVGPEFELSLGVSVPAGPIRIVPKTTLGMGAFNSLKSGGQSADVPSADRATHVFVFLGLAAFYSLDFGAKPAAD